MRDERLIHDVSWAASLEMTHIVAALLREEEKLDFRYEADRVIRDAIQAYCLHKQRELQRLKPSQN